MRARTRITTLIGAALAAAALSAPAGAETAAPGATGASSGTLETYALPGLGYDSLTLNDGCHTFDGPRMVSFIDSEPIAVYAFYTGPDCTGSTLGSGRDDTQWIPPLQGARSVRVDFE
ncbi:hypothetical protein ACFPZ0_26580 [Streptomonospora nanhaiensis]|uniref:Beta/gamma crystallin 'Greek key' domain-containing protein n=1 Tax=Streptomonospora nanhaiensis TaxID=1323731 RepID=A0A853BQ30_9ACTN|nr:hypothetical protein [Streptomonospora nanhaiensis]MBV2363925.1 hypothetical protein [Streptomonospora nanhaiensis]MBX9391708.1 hypothetical protein [Streptomonospora nanhaiensis]NYI96766.1 hypothetical protein [Streptomonospora nanhaiensis]